MGTEFFFLFYCFCMPDDINFAIYLKNYLAGYEILGFVFSNVELVNVC